MLKHACVLICAVALVTSCASAQRFARRLDDPRATTSKVIIGSAHLHPLLRAAAVRVERNENNLLEIEVHFLNDSSTPLSLHLRLIFRDHRGQQIEQRDQPPIVLPPGQRHVFTATARSLLAQDFIIEVRDAHE